MLRLPRPYLYSGILFFSILGGYSVNQNPTDILILVTLGLLGFVMRRYGLPVVPTVIGVILGTLTFAIVNQGIYYTGWNSDWAALILGILLLVAVLMNNTFRRLALSQRKA